MSETRSAPGGPGQVRTLVVAGAALVASTGLLLALRLASAGSTAPPAQPTPVVSAAVPPADHPQGPVPAVDAGGTSATPPVERVALGRAIFLDDTLSEPRGTSCASCHDPSRAFAGDHGSKLGVPLGSRPGHLAKRSSPSLLYLKFVRPFRLHWEEDAPLVDAYGGFFWDGRVDSLAELVKQPLLNPDEMNGQNTRTVAGKIAAAPWAGELARQSPGALDDPDAAVRALGVAIEAYLLSPEMAPFTSRYDDFVRGGAPLSPLEARGMALFKDSAKGGCAACHRMDDRSKNPERSLFTDYAFDAVAPPRNRALPATRDPAYFDLGLCERRDAEYKAQAEQFCGSFRTPSLRNVAVRSSYMHNGTFTRLRDVVAFYATRATNPKRWYGPARAYDDMPAKYREYVNVDKAPYNRQEGETPALDDGEVDAIVAFLGTLTDKPAR